MAAKRRRIVKEDIDFGTGTVDIPTDSGGTRTGTQVNATSLPSPWVGNFSITGNLAVSGTVTASDLTSTDDVLVTDDLAVTGAATIGETLGVTGNTTLSGTLAAGASTLASAAITGVATVGGALTVTGALTAPAAYKTAAMSGGDATVTTEQDLTGATVSLDRIGNWLVIGTFYATVNAAANAGNVVGYLNVDGSNQTALATMALTATGQGLRATVSQSWLVTIAAQPKTAKLRAAQTVGTATITVHESITTIRAIYLGT